MFVPQTPGDDVSGGFVLVAGFVHLKPSKAPQRRIGADQTETGDERAEQHGVAGQHAAVDVTDMRAIVPDAGDAKTPHTMPP